jgi:hypothetical protein
MKVTLVAFFAAAALVASAGCGGGRSDAGDKTFEGDGFSFSYPADWIDQEEFEFRAQAGSEATSQVAVAPGHGQDVVVVEVGPVSPSISEGNIDQFKFEVARSLEALFQKVEGELTAGPARVRVGGLPALRFEATGVTSQGVRTRSRLTLVFDGNTQYTVNCQFTPEGAEEVKRGCDQILSSFRVEGGGGGEDNTFEGDGYSFVYPGEWVESEGEVVAQAGDCSPPAYFGPEEGSDALVVGVCRLRIPITEESIDELSDQFAAEVNQVFREGQGRITKGPTRATVDGLPALRFEGSTFDPDGVRVQSRLVFVLDGTTEYYLNCQFTPERAQELKRGCGQAVESFQVE